MNRQAMIAKVTDLNGFCLAVQPSRSQASWQ